MDQITLRLDEELLEAVEDEADEHGRSRSEHIRAILDERHDAETVDVASLQVAAREHCALQRELDECRRDRERLRNEKRNIINQREEHGELVEFVEQEKTLQERREERASSNVLRRFKWWLTGAPIEDGEDEGSA